MENGIFLYFHWQNGFWVTGNENENGNGKWSKNRLEQS